MSSHVCEKDDNMSIWSDGDDGSRTHEVKERNKNALKMVEVSADLKDCVSSDQVKEKSSAEQKLNTQQSQQRYMMEKSGVLCETQISIPSRLKAFSTLSSISKDKNNLVENNITSQENQVVMQKHVQENSTLNMGIQVQGQEQSAEVKDSLYSLKNSIKNNFTFPNAKNTLQYPTKIVSDSAPISYKHTDGYPFCGIIRSGIPKYTTQKGEMKSQPNSFQNYNCIPNNANKSEGEITAFGPEPLPSQSHQMKHISSTHVPYSQYSLFHQQQQPKLHLYSSNYNVENPHYNNLAQNSHISQCMSQEHNDAFIPAAEGNPNLHSNSNNVSNSCEYPTHFPDYSYGSYNHPNYVSPFHSNTFATGPPVPRTPPNPYHMHWSPLISPTSIHDQYNTVHSSTYTQNSAQYNQWHHKL